MILLKKITELALNNNHSCTQNNHENYQIVLYVCCSAVYIVKLLHFSTGLLNI